MDVTCCMNCQNKPLFLMVDKDTNGESHIGNISALPSEKKGVFNEMFKHVFVELFGEHTVCRNFLMLTDEDSAPYKPIMDSIATRVEYQQIKHMLCMFHAIAKKFKEKIYPQLPHLQGEYKLNYNGEKYGTYYYFGHNLIHKNSNTLWM